MVHTHVCSYFNTIKKSVWFLLPESSLVHLKDLEDQEESCLMAEVASDHVLRQ